MPIVVPHTVGINIVKTNTLGILTWLEQAKCHEHTEYCTMPLTTLKVHTPAMVGAVKVSGSSEAWHVNLVCAGKNFLTTDLSRPQASDLLHSCTY